MIFNAIEGNCKKFIIISTNKEKMIERAINSNKGIEINSQNLIIFTLFLIYF